MRYNKNKFHQLPQPDFIPIATQVVFYRAPQPRPCHLDFETYEIASLTDSPEQNPFIAFFDLRTMHLHHYPLRYHLLLLCINTIPYQWINMHKTGGEGVGSGTDVYGWIEVICSLFDDLMHFPRGFNAYPLDLSAPAITPGAYIKEPK